MVLSVGTFNLNNLFSRFNYEAEVSELPEEDVVISSSTTFPVADPTAHRFRTYRGRLVMGKPAEERVTIADRIARMDADVLAVQEVEDIDTLKRSNTEDLGPGMRSPTGNEGVSFPVQEPTTVAKRSPS
jgi:hypothetical protein